MRPLLPVLLAFIAGLLSSSALGFSWAYAFVVLALSLFPALYLYARGRRFSRFSGALPFFALGVLFFMPYSRPGLGAHHIRNFIKDAAVSSAPGAPGAFDALGTVVEGVVDSEPAFTDTRTRLYVEARRVLKGEAWQDASGRVYLTIDGRAEGLAPGDTVRFVAELREPFNFGNPGEFDYRGWLAARGVYATGYVRHPGLIVRLSKGPSSVARYLHYLRARIDREIDASGAHNAGLLKALVTGEKGGIDPGIEEAFKMTGTAHILAISGLHIGMVAFFSYWVFLFLLKRSERLMLAFNVKKAAMVLSLFPVLAYAALSGLATSTQRAVIMALALMFAYLFERGRDYMNAVCLAALLILAWTPHALWEASFQLTFAAVVGIVYITPRLYRVVAPLFASHVASDDHLKASRRSGALNAFVARAFRGYIVLPLLATVAAGLATAPIIAYHFHRVSLIGLAANVAVVPLGALVVPTLLAAAFVAPLWYGAGYALMNAAGLVMDVMVAVVRFFSSIPYSGLWVSEPTVLETMLFYGALCSAVNLKKGRAFLYVGAACALLLVADSAYWSRSAAHEGEMKVTFISVGQGDSALVELPGGKTMLIDGGGAYASGFDAGESVVAPLLWYKKIKRIDYMVLSHAQADHMGGLGFIAGNFSVGEFWWNGAGSLGRLGRVLEKNGVRERVIDEKGVSVNEGGAKITAFRPYTDPTGVDLNDMSVVLRLSFGSSSFLFTGDLAGPGEAGAVRRGRITADVLKAPHHGSKYSSSTAFLNAVAPSLVVVSAGRYNRFGFPQAEALERYRKAGARVLRTDTGGAVIVKTDGRYLAGGAWLTDGAW